MRGRVRTIRFRAAHQHGDQNDRDDRRRDDEQCHCDSAPCCNEPDQRAEQAYNDSERTRNKAHEAAEALSAKTDYECRTQKENAQKEAEAITNKATSEAYVLRKNVKKECDAVSKYMGELLAA